MKQLTSILIIVIGFAFIIFNEEIETKLTTVEDIRKSNQMRSTFVQHMNDARTDVFKDLVETSYVNDTIYMNILKEINMDAKSYYFAWTGSVAKRLTIEELEGPGLINDYFNKIIIVMSDGERFHINADTHIEHVRTLKEYQ